MKTRIRKVVGELFVITTVLLWLAFGQSAQAQTTRTDNEDNLGVVTDRQQTSPNFILDSVLDVVGGESVTPDGGSAAGQILQHGYFFLDGIENVIQIMRLIAVPEKRIPATGNNATIISQLILRAVNSNVNDPVVAEITATAPDEVYWTNAQGAYISGEDGRPILEFHDVSPGTYDVYVKGYSTLSKKVPDITLVEGQNALQLTASEAATTLQPDPNDADYYLLGGDVNVITDLDGSCGDPIGNCHNVLAGYTGDEIGDDKVNSIDMGILVQKLFQTSEDNGAINILKEDLNGDGKVNSLDLGIAVTNILKTGGE